jgi:predicted N-acetyltransferase YhbS
MLEEIIKRIKSKKSQVSHISYGDSVPEYWQPGVDLRHTSLYFFLLKNGFKTHKMRQNLRVDLRSLLIKPLSIKGDFKIERIQTKDYKVLFNFVKKNFPAVTWAEEVQFTFENDPPTTFVAKNNSDEIIGWASHSQVFPGSFGPTGVLTSLRGQAIGSELLYWCLWDIKRQNNDFCTIMWVDGDTIKFYSKAVGAYIHAIFIPMSLKI